MSTTAQESCFGKKKSLSRARDIAQEKNACLVNSILSAYFYTKQARELTEPPTAEMRGMAHCFLKSWAWE